MKTALTVVALLFVAHSSRAADPTYLDQLMETPLSSLQREFTGLKSEGCYRIAADRFLLVDIDKKDQKPWRIVITSSAPCRRPLDGPLLDVRARNGVELGETSLAVIERIGRPDASAAPEPALRKLGDLEFFYICRVTEGCARHTSVFFRDGAVTAISEWYSE